MSMSVADELKRFEAVSLDELDRRAALQKRVDHKYVIGGDRLSGLLDELCADHDALEIDGRRSFDYRSVYFDTPQLTCFEDHVDDRRPRYKVRTRHYVTTHGCVFEVKVKREDGETVKRSIDYEGADDDRLTDAAKALIDEALGQAGARVPDELAPTLVTQFTRSTLGLRDGAERMTIDRDVRLTCGEGESLVMHGDRALLETKTEDGSGRADRALRDAGLEPVSFSKYRLGVGRLLASRDDSGYAEPLLEHFAFEPAPDDDAAGRIFDSQRSSELGVGMSPSPQSILGD